MIHEGRFRRRLSDDHEYAKLTTIVQAMVFAASRYVHGSASQMDGIIRKKVVAAAMDHVSLENLQALIIVAYTDVSTVGYLLSIFWEAG